LLVFTLAFLAMQASTAAACFMTRPGPDYIQNPHDVIKDAYFIGIVKVLSMNEIAGQDMMRRWIVEPLHAYKTGADYKREHITAVGIRGHSMCNTNSSLMVGHYVEATILREKRSLGGADYGFTITTDSLGKERWSALRKKSPLPIVLRAKKLKCLIQGGTWSASDLESERT
jgi:hypothetical protein